MATRDEKLITAVFLGSLAFAVLMTYDVNVSRNDSTSDLGGGAGNKLIHRNHRTNQEVNPYYMPRINTKGVVH